MYHTASPASALAYSFDEHKHRYAAWAASRAASTFTCRFRVETGMAVIHAAGLRARLGAVETLPPPEEAMAWQRDARLDIIDAAAAHGLTFSHGIAAKLLGMYTKGYLLDQSNAGHPAVMELQPPVDGEMLKSLLAARAGNVALWKSLQAARWTRFTSEQLEAAIMELRRILGPDVPLWQAERYWPGFRR